MVVDFLGEASYLVGSCKGHEVFRRGPWYTNSVELARLAGMEQCRPWVFCGDLPEDEVTDRRYRLVTALYRGHNFHVHDANLKERYLTTYDPIAGEAAGLVRVGWYKWVRWVPREHLTDLVCTEHRYGEERPWPRSPKYNSDDKSGTYARMQGHEFWARQLSGDRVKLRTRDPMVAAQHGFGLVPSREDRWEGIVPASQVEAIYKVTYYAVYHGSLVMITEESSDSYRLYTEDRELAHRLEMIVVDRGCWELHIWKSEASDVLRVEEP